METYLLVCLIIPLLLSGLPIAFCLAVPSSIILYRSGLPLEIVAYKMFGALDSFPLMAVPFFILASNILLRGGMANDLMEFCNSFLRRLPGGIGVATMLACVVFAALSGSSVANAAAIGIVAIPMMVERQFPREFASGIVASGGTLGILIPPSIILIIYGAITSESVGKLFMAGFVPGLILASLLSLVIMYLAKKKGYGTYDDQTPINWKEILKIGKKSFFTLLMPIFVLGSIYSGIVTPTEAAVIAVFYAFCYSIISGSLTLRGLIDALSSSAELTAMIFLLICCSTLFSFAITQAQIPQDIINYVVNASMSKWSFLICVNIILLAMGCILDVISVMLISLPIVYPIVIFLGIDPIHFAIVMVINLEIGTVSPPVGMNLFVLSGVTDMPIGRIVRGVLPFAAALIFGLLLITYVPILSLWLPSFMR